MTRGDDATFDLLARFAERAAERPDAAALIDTSGRALTRDALLRRTRDIALGFGSLGMAPGDSVLFSVRPGVDAVTLMVGVSAAGGTIVPVDPGMGDALFATRIALLRPRWVLAQSSLLAASSGGVLTRVLGWRGIRLPPIARLTGVTFVRVGPPFPGAPAALSLRALLRAGQHSAAAFPSVDMNTPALVVFTSGTTWTPKAVVHTRRSLQAILTSVENAIEISEHDTLYGRDLHLVLPALCRGARVVMPRPSHFSPRQALRDIESFGVTHMFAVTSDCNRLLDYCLEHKRLLPASLRTILIGAAPVHAAFLQRFKQILQPHTQVYCVYGMTEILPVSCVSMQEKLAYEGTGDLVGTPLPRITTRLSDRGELLLRGPSLFDRYLGDAPVLEHATGDLARVDQGRIVLLGRVKDMIIRGETNIYPELYEPTIERIPGVRRCAMIGEYSERLADECVVLALEPAAGVDAEDLRHKVRSALREGPWRIDTAAQPDFIFTMPLPESGRSSKVDKARLRDLVRERLQCA